MNTLPTIDPSLAMQEASQQDLIQRKLGMDSLRQRLGDSTTKQEKLRESCEGFEAIFLQKMWEQMRKNVPKEGYLHSKDEETYQSLFDIELCKKMASAGGIGLGDMLYQQLSQQLEDTGRTVSPSSYRQPISVPASEMLMASSESSTLPQVAPVVAAVSGDGASKTPFALDELYSPLPSLATVSDAEEDLAPKEASNLELALSEIKTDLGLVPTDGEGVVAASWAVQREALMTGMDPTTLGEAENAGVIVPATQTILPNTASDRAVQDRQELAKLSNEEIFSDARKEAAGFLATTWQSNAQVSASPKPIPRQFGSTKTSAQGATEEKPAQRSSMSPVEIQWPYDGEVISKFGWENDPDSGRRHWNAGVKIAATDGSPVRAVLDGSVVFSGQREGLGHSVVLEHSNGFRSYYSNLKESNLKVGDKITIGSSFAEVTAQNAASENEANSAFLHFELKRGEMALNPESAIQRKMVTASNK